MAVEIETASVSEPEPVPVGKSVRQPRRRSAIVFVAIAILLAFGGVATLLLLPPSSSLQEYVSPPLDASGTRVKMKIPAGWSEYNPTLRKAPFGVLLIVLRPPDKPPAWLTRFGRPAWVRGEPVVLTITLQNRLSVQVPRIYSIQVTNVKAPFSPTNYYEADCTVDSPDRKYEATAHYVRTNKAAFDHTCKTILNSVRIER
jgi:hypothetical protein